MSTCPVCDDPHALGDVFCENCGYDFLSETAPDPAPDSVPDSAGEGEVEVDPVVVAPAAPTARIEVDADFHKIMDPDGQLALPDSLPEAVEVTLPDVTLVGRTSHSRGVFPELDIQALTNDSAVSHRHAILRRREDGVLLVTDLDSTNGTYLDGAADGLAPNLEVEVAPGMTVHVGAWTRITILA
ncbi:MAG: hypothetical protein ACI8Y4_000235 [Candidatus Poriferisodalaceae bacterium]|jgi:hypothetical protein